MSRTCILVNFPGYPTEPFGLVPDNGIAQLAGVLSEAGHKVLVEDYATLSTMEKLYPAHERAEMESLAAAAESKALSGEGLGPAESNALSAMESRIDAWQEDRIRQMGAVLAGKAKKTKAAFVGFKLWSGQGFTGSRVLAEEIRRTAPGISIFAGGPNVDWFMGHCAANARVFDALAFGEGEGTIIELADRAGKPADLADVPGIVLPSGKVNPPAAPVRLDSLPLPEYGADVYPSVHQPGEKIRVFLLDESRGCPNSCNFCCHPVKSGRRRAMDPAGFVDRLETLNRKHGVSHFRFAGSNPPVAQRAAIAREICGRGLDVSFGGFAHVSNGATEDFGLLARAGCKVLSFGVESGSQSILDRAMNKKVNVTEVREALKSCSSAGIATVASLIVPAPFETAETLEETFSLITDVRPDSTMVFFPVAVPDTAWFKERARFGFGLPPEEEYARRVMTLRVKPYGSPALWGPSQWYSLAGKRFGAIARVTASFMKRLENAGLCTQVYDSVFLIARASGLDPLEFAKSFDRFARSGDFDSLRNMVMDVNSGLAGRFRGRSSRPFGSALPGCEDAGN